jgi:hypothetical protein
MQNGHDQPPAQKQINPQQAAAFALQFLGRCSHTRAEREAYDVAEGMLNAIMSGQVVLAPPPAMPALTADAAAPPAPGAPA